MSRLPPAMLVSGGALLACLAAFVWVGGPGPASVPGEATPPVPGASAPTNVPAKSMLAPVALAKESPRIEQPPRPTLDQLRQAIASGLPPDRIAALLDGLPDPDLGALFEAETHITRRWMQERGIDAAGQRQLAALWLSTSATTLPPAVEGTIAFRGQAAAADRAAVPSAQEHQVNAAFALPAGYAQDAVIVRWVDLDRRSVVSLDRHLVTAGEQQEVWMRSSQDWKPGRYRVEIFAADAGLQPVAGASLDLQDKDPQ